MASVYDIITGNWASHLDDDEFDRDPTNEYDYHYYRLVDLQEWETKFRIFSQQVSDPMVNDYVKCIYDHIPYLVNFMWNTITQQIIKVQGTHNYIRLYSTPLRTLILLDKLTPECLVILNRHQSRLLNHLEEKMKHSVGENKPWCVPYITYAT